MIKHSALYEKLQKQYLQNWTICSEQFPVSGKRFSYFEKRIWEMKFDRFLQVIKKKQIMNILTKIDYYNKPNRFLEKH